MTDRDAPDMLGETAIQKPEKLPGNYYNLNPSEERSIQRGPYSFEDLYGRRRKLTLLQKHFADCYLSNGGEALGAYIDSHPDSKAKPSSQRTRAKELLMNPNISGYISKNMGKYGFGDMNVEIQHLMLLNQHGDLRVKMQAIDTFYKLRGAYSDDKTSGTEEELAQALNKIAGFLNSDEKDGKEESKEDGKEEKKDDTSDMR